MRQFKAALLSLLLFGSFSVSAGIFGPSDPRECILKHQPAVKLDDAKLVLRMACVFGYGDAEFEREQKKIGKCIVSDAKKFYSFESTLKVINKCTGSNVGMFTYFKNQLYSSQNQMIEDELARIRQRQRNEDFDRRFSGGSQDGPITIYDSTTGTYKYCHKNSGVLTCF